MDIMDPKGGAKLYRSRLVIKNVDIYINFVHIGSKVHLYREFITPILFFASEHRALRRSEIHIIKMFHKKV